MRIVVLIQVKEYIYPGDALRFDPHRHELPCHGSAGAVEILLRHPGKLDEAGESHADGVEEIRRAGRGQRRVLFDFRHAR